ncbi:rolling circle replication-associated protein [Roseovarius amoyensis]|uniref:rolling circle replication-associated protein n=1 Tax=Roseovarius amoyensis TaxID=2211448 RepID=UPI0013A6931B|nr:hypothetical protein [Roseovarius amoyensis]
MCISPGRLYDDDYDEGFVLIPCRNCWQCRKNRVNDLVGRCIAESKTADQTVAVTFTYAGDSPNCATLVYKDFQDFMKRLRYEGYRVRYIVAGEYGSERGRAHWHAILFFYGKTLVARDAAEPRTEWEIRFARYKNDAAARIFWQPWSAHFRGEPKTRGFVYFQRPDYESFGYALKQIVEYALKDSGTFQAAHVGHVSMSKKPPLGHDWFIDLANRYIQQGLSPQNPGYSFPDVFDSEGKRRKFWLQGRMREMFVEYFMWAYRSYHGREYPFSELLAEHQTRIYEELWDHDVWEAAQRRMEEAKSAQPARKRVPEWLRVPGWDYKRYFWDGKELRGGGRLTCLNGLTVRIGPGIAWIEKEFELWLVSDPSDLVRRMIRLGATQIEAEQARDHLRESQQKK